MELNSQVNTFIGGMNLDGDISFLDKTQYRYAENIRLLADENGTTGVLLNREGLYKINWLHNETILGVAPTRFFDKESNSSDEVIVVITLDEQLYNSIYIIKIKDNNITQQTLIKSKQLGWVGKLKIVTNYESDNVSNIYVADGINPIKVLNLATLDINAEYTADMFDILPNAYLNKPEIIEIIPGRLSVGSVAYAYQLFQKNGKESAISSLSGIINLPKYTGNSNCDVLGGNKGEISQCGCHIRIEVDVESNFDYAKIYRIKYDSNNQVAQVLIINESNIVGNEIYYKDVDDNSISSITVDEFNMLTATEFVPKVIEKHDNRLFAANTKETIWPIEYDARAYRCDKEGNIELHHSNTTLNLLGKLLPDGTIENVDVPIDHDCINPSNLVVRGEDSFKYSYYPEESSTGAINYKLGGIGKNILYEFCFTELNLSHYTTNYFKTWDEHTVGHSLMFGSNKHSGSLAITDYKGSVIKRLSFDNKITNYSDSWFTTNFLGYQRDEIYRFGIVFYDKKNRKSPVYWIGDIRMPSTDMLNTTDLNNRILPFVFNQGGVDLHGYALGVKFTVKELAPGAVRYEIVRCPRTETDRTIVAQGALSGLIQFDSWGTHKYNYGYNDIRPMTLLNCGDMYNVVAFDSFYEFECAEDYFEFICPEACVSKSNLEQHLKNSVLCNTLAYSGLFYTQEYDNIESSKHIRWAVRQQNIYTIDPENFNADTDYYAGEYKIRFKDDKYWPFLLDVNDSSAGGHNVGGSGQALLLKYYKNKIYESNKLKQYNILDAIVAEPLPYVRTIEETKNYSKAVGNKLYINTTIGGENVINNHGVTAVLLLSEGSKDLWFETKAQDQMHYCKPFSAMDAAWVCNIKKPIIPYGGNKYENRVSSIYVGCVEHKVNANSTCVYGGDTYLNVFDYVHTTFSLESNDSKKDSPRNVFINCYIPLESSINTDLFTTPTYNKLVTINNNIEGEGGTALNLLLYEPTVTTNYVLSEPLYVYNSAYSSDNDAQVFVPNLLYVDENPIFETRITCSELKTNNEIIDSWTKFKFANYMDVDNQYGPVTNLKSFKGKLFFWLDSAIGVASVNERSLIQDNNIAQLTLGTGGILVRYDYYSTMNGSVIPNDRSICNSASTLYWFDSAKSEICAINNQFVELSKSKNVKSWSNGLSKNQDAIGWYDWKYNEILFQHPSDKSERSIVFNELLNAFTSFYTYPTSHAVTLTDKLITFDSIGNVYTHWNESNYEPFTAKIIFLINQNYMFTKVFDNVSFDADLSDNTVIGDIIFKTKTQQTKPVNYNNIDVREDTYRLPIGREYDGVGRMRGKYLICDYTFNCEKENDLKIPYIKTTYRYSRL